MLVLSRKVGEAIRIGDDIVIKVQEIRGSRVRIAIEGPRHVPILRAELAKLIENGLAASSACCEPAGDVAGHS